uniref:Uncharacterized protein n=1 Tax=Lotharella oceanica TaxID=641309 RepID=A0A7S2XEX9_9EUKA|mmetsp:Transcript_33367/g.62044  ORF Transcript_33367/g.62044 Transcript_33367/m.62044 type:complete len:289 (+) Transcript_33367:214-1080(+)
MGRGTDEQMAVYKLLLHSKANVRSNFRGYNVLHAEVKKECFQLLVHAKADINFCADYMDMRQVTHDMDIDKNGGRIYSGRSPLEQHILYGNVEIVKFLVEEAKADLHPTKIHSTGLRPGQRGMEKVSDWSSEAPHVLGESHLMLCRGPRTLFSGAKTYLDHLKKEHWCWESERHRRSLARAYRKEWMAFGLTKFRIDLLLSPRFGRESLQYYFEQLASLLSFYVVLMCDGNSRDGHPSKMRILTSVLFDQKFLRILRRDVTWTLRNVFPEIIAAMWDVESELFKTMQQ